MKDGKPLYRTTYVISQPIDVHVEKRNAGRQNNSKAYDLNNTRRTVTFISNYADDHALVPPGRVPGFQRDDIRLMLSSETKVKVYRTGHLCVMWVCYGLKLVNVYHYHIIILTRRAPLFASRAHTTSGCSRDNNNLLDCYVPGYEFQSVVNGSADTNSAQLVGREDGTPYVQVGNWQAHLSPFYRPLPAINSYQHFRFDSIHPGKVFARKTLDSPETELNVSYRKQLEPLAFQEMNETESQEANYLWLFTRQRKAMII